MRTLRSNSHWVVALVGGVCLVAGAVGMAQRQPELDVPPAADARDLSTIFRRVSKEALPSIVSIETRSKVARQTQTFDFPFEDSPFREFFRNDPQLRQFFQNAPRQRRSPSVRGMGSGFIIDASGIIMTNSHVVNEVDEVIVKLHDGREFVATDVRTDPRTDIAIVKIEDASGLKAIKLGDSDRMQVGDWVLAVGSPFGLELTVTSGIISAKGRGPGIADREDFLQTDAAINPGNSGGPLLNLNGEVIGINTAISSRGGGSDGIGFAIPINMAKWVSDQLIATGEVERAYLGVSIQSVDADLAEQFQTEVGRGAIVIQVMPGSPADKANLQPGDVILELDGKKVHSTRNLQGIVEMLEIGKEYPIVYLRKGETQTGTITVEAMPENFSTASLLGGSEENGPSPGTYSELGFQISELTPEIAGQLGYENVEGVVVSSVEPNSPAHRVGISAGDLIQRVGANNVASPEEFEAAVKDVTLKEGVLLLVRNQQGARFVVLREHG